MIEYYSDDIHLRCSTHKILMGVFAGLSAVALILFWYYAVLILKIYRWRNKWLLLFLLFLMLSILSDVLYGIHQIMRYSPTCIDSTDKCVKSILDWTNFVFYLLSIIVNAFNWVFQIINIKACYNDQKLNRKIAWASLFLSISAFLSLYAGYTIYTWTSGSSDDEEINFFSYSFSLCYILVGLFFAASGCTFIKLYSKISPRIAKKINKPIAIDITIITLWWFVRGLLTFIRVFGDFVTTMKNRDFKNNGIMFPLYSFSYYSILTLLPSIAQILMLRFMIILKDKRVFSLCSSDQLSFLNHPRNPSLMQDDYGNESKWEYSTRSVSDANN